MPSVPPVWRKRILERPDTILRRTLPDEQVLVVAGAVRDGAALFVGDAALHLGHRLALALVVPALVQVLLVLAGVLALHQRLARGVHVLARQQLLARRLAA